MNKDLEETPGDQAKIEERDILYRWRSTWLEEYNSQGRSRVEPELEEKFQSMYIEAFEEAYREADEETRKAAEAKLEGWKTRRAQLGRF